MITIQRAVVDDAVAISALLMANGVEQGGALYGEWSIGVTCRTVINCATPTFNISMTQLMR
jgi:hypothetical protein